MSVARSSRECNARSWSDRLFAGIRDKHELALDNVDELVLFRVRMSGRRLTAGHYSDKVDAVVLDAAEVTSRRL